MMDGVKMEVILAPGEIAELFIQAPHTESDGGYQSLLVGLQRRVDRTTGKLKLTAKDLERIPRYAFNYGNGGWENRLTAIFSRTLGPKLGR